MKRTIVIPALLLALTLFPAPTQAAVHPVTMIPFAFQPRNLPIEPGDIVVWTNRSGSHDIVGGTGGVPNGTFNSNSQFGRFMQSGDIYSVTFNSLGSFPYYCSHHWSLGMVGTVTVVPKVHEVTLSDFSFSPRHLTINAGEAVRWVNETGRHDTVSGTNGVPSGEWNSNDQYFRLMQADETFTRIFTTPGTFDYYCTPHWQPESMTGTIEVTRPRPLITNPVHDNGAFQFRVQTEPLYNYSIQRSSSLPPDWVTISGPIPGNGGVLTFTHSNAPAAGGFYRVVIP